MRRPKAKEVYEFSRTNGAIYEFNGAGNEHIGHYNESVGLDELEDIGKEAEKHWDWAWKKSAEEDRDNALKLLAAI